MSPLLNINQLSALTGLAVQTIYNRLHEKGDLPPRVRISRKPLWREEDVDAWFTARIDISSRIVAPQPELKRRRGRPTKAEQIARQLSVS